jgi:hypothetical protein
MQLDRKVVGILNAMSKTFYWTGATEDCSSEVIHQRHVYKGNSVS